MKNSNLNALDMMTAIDHVQCIARMDVGLVEAFLSRAHCAIDLIDAYDVFGNAIEQRAREAAHWLKQARFQLTHFHYAPGDAARISDRLETIFWAAEYPARILLDDCEAAEEAVDKRIHKGRAATALAQVLLLCFEMCNADSVDHAAMYGQLAELALTARALRDYQGEFDMRDLGSQNDPQQVLWGIGNAISAVLVAAWAPSQRLRA